MAKYSTKPIKDPALATTQSLNDEVMREGCDEKRLEELIRIEKRGRHRKWFLYRIQARLNRLRRQREHRELQKWAEK